MVSKEAGIDGKSMDDIPTPHNIIKLIRITLMERINKKNTKNNGKESKIRPILFFSTEGNKT